MGGLRFANLPYGLNSHHPGEEFYMVRMVIALLALSTLPTTAQSVDCQTIKDNQARLECYDKAPPKRPAAPKAKTEPASGGTVKDGVWELSRRKDTMTDKLSCTIFAVGKPYVQISARDLYISYSGRGGVNGFQYRIDDQPATGMQLPTDIEKQIGAVHLSGAAFQQILRARRLRVSTLTLVAGIKEEDLALDGVARLHERLMRECL